MELDVIENTAMAQAIDELHNATAFYTKEPVVDDLLSMLRCPSRRKYASAR